MVDADENSTGNPTDNPTETEAAAGTDPGPEAGDASGEAPAVKKAAARKTTARKSTAKKSTAKKTTARKTADSAAGEAAGGAGPVEAAPETAASAEAAPAKKATTRKSTARKTTARKATTKPAADEESAGSTRKSTSRSRTKAETGADADTSEEKAAAAPMVLFQPPEPTAAPARKRSSSRKPKTGSDATESGATESEATGADAAEPDSAETAATVSAATETEAATVDADTGSEPGVTAEAGAVDDADGATRRRRRRGGRRRRKGGDGDQSDSTDEQADAGAEETSDEQEAGGSRRRRKRRRAGDEGDSSTDEPDKTTTRARKPRSPEDEITSVSGSTRLEAKKQRRREGREAGRRRAPIVSEAEFLARRESVERVMVIRQREDLTQIAVLEDKVLVEHYVAREAQTSLIGNVYLGRVQNVLPSMEAAFIDIGKGRNAVLYAGEVNWSALGHQDGQPRKIESVLSQGQTVLVQVTKDPVGHKGARLTGQVSLPGRFLVYVPDGTTSGISRKLPDTERNRLKTLLKQIVPDTAGVIVRTAAEGASEEELTHDVERLTARWDDIEKKVAAGKAPELLYGEPDLTLKVVRDLFTEDFARLVVQGDDAWDLVEGYVAHVAPDLRDRLERFEPDAEGDANGARSGDVFAAFRVDEQIAKGLDRKVWLPSGGSLIIDRTEAMTVVDVNTGKFTGSGGNLEETVTKNNLEAAEEIVRQLRLRDIGGIIVVDFIDMVLESNRELVLRRLVECLGRDRTRHQVAEVTSLGLVQMTRKRIGTGLLEAFSEDCPHCKGRGVLVHEHPVEPGRSSDDERGKRGRSGRGRGGRSGSGSGSNGGGKSPEPPAKPSPMDLAGSRPPTEQQAEQPDEPPVQPETPLETEPEIEAETQPEIEPVSDQPSADEQPADPSTTEPETAPEADEPAQPEAPRVVTTTRRRTVRRPAGAPTPREEPSYDPMTGPDQDHAAPDDSADDNADDSADDSAHDNAQPIGPDDPVADGEDADPDGPVVPHVPIKRKGARKR